MATIDDLTRMGPEEFARVREETRRRHDTEPRALLARYQRQTDRLVITLTSGVELSVPRSLLQGLQGATEDQLERVEILGRGYGLHWEELDADLTVPGLAAGLFGTKAWMARLAGQVRSEAKARTARENGKRGGRPRKSAPAEQAATA